MTVSGSVTATRLHPDFSSTDSMLNVSPGVELKLAGPLQKAVVRITNRCHFGNLKLAARIRPW